MCASSPAGLVGQLVGGVMGSVNDGLCRGEVVVWTGQAHWQWTGFAVDWLTGTLPQAGCHRLPQAATGCYKQAATGYYRLLQAAASCYRPLNP